VLMGFHIFERRSEFNWSGQYVQNEIPTYDGFDLPSRNHRFSPDITGDIIHICVFIYKYMYIYIYIYMCVCVCV